MSASQYSMRSLLIFVAVAAAYFPCSRIYNTWYQSRIRSNHSFHYVELILETKLQNGDTVQDVAKHFDNARLITSKDVNVNANIARVWGNKGLTIKKDDQFYFFSLSTGAGGHLQFRQGKLVNLWNTAYTSNPMGQPGQLTRPSQLLAFGFLLSYLVVVVLGAVTIHFLQKRRISRSVVSTTMLGHVT